MLNSRKLRQLVESQGADYAATNLIEGLGNGTFRWSDFSIRDLAESLIVSQDGNPVGHEWVRQLGPQKSGGLTLLEASSAVDLSRFSNITGQIFYNRILEAYAQQEFVAASLVSENQTDLNGEKIPGMTGMTDDLTDDIHEGEQYPQVGFNEDYVETPVTTKKGRIVSVSKETIFFDRTNLVMKQAGAVGELLIRRKDKRIWDVILGIVNSYKWKGTSYNSYQTATPWINKRTGVDSGATTFDWTQIDTSEQLFVNMLDPYTSEPITITPSNIICMPARKHRFRHILQATSMQTRTQTSTELRNFNNTLDPYNLIANTAHAYRRLIANGVSAADANNYWLMGDFKKAFGWQYNWPLTVVQAPSNSEPEFTQDIVLRWKASERGSAYVIDPRYAQLVINN